MWTLYTFVSSAVGEIDGGGGGGGGQRVGFKMGPASLQNQCLACGLL